jgi:hypothetical protein
MYTLSLSLSISPLFFLLPLFLLYPSILAHDIKRKKGKFVLIGSNEKKKSQYKVKIQSTPEIFFIKSFGARLLFLLLLLLLLHFFKLR